MKKNHLKQTRRNKYPAGPLSPNTTSPNPRRTNVPAYQPTEVPTNNNGYRVTNGEEVTRASVYSPTLNESLQLNTPPWLNDDGKPNETYLSQSPAGMRIGGTGKAHDSAPPDIMPLVNSFRGAFAGVMANHKDSDDALKHLQQMRTLNQELRTMINNDLYARAGWMFNSLLDPRGRDLYVECGYPLEISPQAYRQMYDRDPIGARVVEIMPEECWENVCEIYDDENEEEDTAFEKAVKDLDATNYLFHYMERIDKLSGIGHYGLLLLGIDDGIPLNMPIDGLDEKTGLPKSNPKPHKLLYMRAFDESLCHVGRYNTDQTTARYSQPEIYLIRFLDYTVVPIGQTVTDVITHMVHWTRVVHIADNRKSSEVFGLPRMQSVWNRLLDLRKLYGGSAEMFWKGGFPGIALEVLPELADAQIDLPAVKEQMDAYMNSLKRYIALTGMTAKTLSSTIQKPKEHIDAQLQAISIAKGIPWRVFVGTEQAVKAGEQDSDAWDVRLQRRKNMYLTPWLVRPTIDRLIAMGVLPQPKEQYKVSWPESSAPTEKDKAAIATARAQSLSAFLTGQGDQMLAPLDFFVKVWGVDRREAQEMVENALEYVQEQQAQQGGLPDPQDLANATGMDPQDAQQVLEAIQQWQEQQQTQQQPEPDNASGGQAKGAPYQQGPSQQSTAGAGLSGGISGGIGSSGTTGSAGGTAWSVGGSPKGSA